MRTKAICLLVLLVLIPDFRLEAVERIPNPQKQSYKTSETGIRLTESEKAWIAEHPSISAGFASDIPPLFFEEDDVMKGILPDYLRLIGVYSGLKFDVTHVASKDMDEFLRTARIDMASGFDISKRKAYTRNTQPLMNLTLVVVGRDGTPLISGLNALNGTKMAVVTSIKIYNLILKGYPDIERYETNSFEGAIAAVASGKADTLISAMVMVAYLFRNHPDLKILGLVGIPAQPLMLSVRKDFPQLVSILNKTLAAIPKEEKDAVIQKWFKVQIEHKTDWAIILKWIGGISVAFIFVLCIFFYWNKKLVREITERKQAERALRESEKRLKIFFDFANDGILIANSEGWIFMANKTLGEMLGYTQEELKAKKVMDIHTTENLTHVHEQFRLLSEGKIQVAEINMMRKDGSIFATDVKASHITLEGEVYIMGSFRDIREQKRLEAQLQQAQKMEAVGTLAGGIAHDFNNILAIILGNAELASNEVPDLNPASDSLKEIYDASIRARDMVKQLLAFSRKTDEETKPIDMAPIIQQSMKMLRSAIPTSVEFKEHISDDPCSVMGDAAQINQIMMNLVTNAADAMSEEGGLLEATLEKIILQEEKPCFDWVLSPGAYVRLRMRDTGDGIEPTTMKRIFDPYYTTKEVGKGTGMGLSVVHGIVKRYDGGILVESTLGKGTVFEIYFPTLEKMAAEEKEPEVEIKGGSESILFVDDEEAIVNLNHQRLERLGYEIKSTTKPLEALAWFKADPDGFDVVITDMTMPKMTGDRLLMEILAIRPHMLTIICTGYSERMSSKKAEALGASKYLEKPVGSRKLTSALREVLDQRNRP